MNGISMDNPFAMLMGLNVGAGQGLTPTLGAPEGANLGGADLLGFVNALEVSQGPQSPMGDDLSALVGDLQSSDLEIKKQAELVEPSSGDLVNAMMMNTPAMNLANPVVLTKTNDEMNVGRKEIPMAMLSAAQQPAPQSVSGETLLLGDLAVLAATPKPTKNSSDKLEEKDVAAWTQAFAQDEIESIDLIPAEQRSTEVPSQMTDKLSSDEKLSVAKAALEPVQPMEMAKSSELLKPLDNAKPLDKAQKTETQTTAAPKVAEANKGFEPFVAAKAERHVTATIAPKSGNEFSAFKDEKTFKPKEKDVAVNASDLMLGREALMDGAANTKQSNTLTLKSAGALGNATDMRLSDDSVKMLADKIDAIKQNGSSTLRVVVNPTDVGRVEIRVLKIGGELRVQLHSDSKAVVKALEESRSDLVSKLSDRGGTASVEIRSEIQSMVSDSSSGGSLKNVLHSSDLVRMGSSSEIKTNMSSSSEFGSDLSGKNNPEFKNQQGREDSRDRGMRKWQGVFEERESA